MNLMFFLKLVYLFKKEFVEFNVKVEIILINSILKLINELNNDLKNFFEYEIEINNKLYDNSINNNIINSQNKNINLIEIKIKNIKMKKML